MPEVVMRRSMRGLARKSVHVVIVFVFMICCCGCRTSDNQVGCPGIVHETCSSEIHFGSIFAFLTFSAPAKVDVSVVVVEPASWTSVASERVPAPESLAAIDAKMHRFPHLSSLLPHRVLQFLKGLFVFSFTTRSGC